jgi:hypothetical protein
MPPRLALPIPPGDPLKEDWEVFDDSRDYKTEWFRRCTDHIAETRLGGPAVTGLTARRSAPAAHRSCTAWPASVYLTGRRGSGGSA